MWTRERRVFNVVETVFLIPVLARPSLDDLVVAFLLTNPEDGGSNHVGNIFEFFRSISKFTNSNVLNFLVGS